MKNSIAPLAIISIALLLDLPSRAASVTLDAAKDVTLFQNAVNNSSGGGNGLFAGTTGMGSPRRGLMAFDMTGQVPPGSVIQSVQLSLVLAQGASANSTVELHRLLGDWGEGVKQQSTPPSDSSSGQGQGAAADAGDATWNAKFFSPTTPILWTNPGGDFDPIASAASSVGATANVTYVWGSTPDIVSDVQDWLNDPSTNHGWLLKGADEVAASNVRVFYSRNVATAAFFPKLSITYVPEPSILVHTLTALMLLTTSKRRAMLEKAKCEGG